MPPSSMLPRLVPSPSWRSEEPDRVACMSSDDPVATAHSCTPPRWIASVVVEGMMLELPAVSAIPSAGVDVGVSVRVSDPVAAGVVSVYELSSTTESIESVSSMTGLPPPVPEGTVAGKISCAAVSEAEPAEVDVPPQLDVGDQLSATLTSPFAASFVHVHTTDGAAPTGEGESCPTTTTAIPLTAKMPRHVRINREKEPLWPALRAPTLLGCSNRRIRRHPPHPRPAPAAGAG